MAARDQHGADAPHDQGFRVVGHENRKVDGLAKATGEAVYTDDIQLPGMLHAKTLRSPHAHARILSIDTSKAEALTGVVGVLVGAELPTKYGVIPWTPDETALAVDKVRFIGDEVAAVAAVDEDTAIDALELIEVEYEILDAILDPQQALVTPEPPIHEDRKRRSNISKHVELEFGDVDGQVESADVVIENDYQFHSTTHAAIEPHCAVAQPNSNGRLTVWSATQITHYVHRALASVLEMDPVKLRVIQPCLGGGFGGKSDPFALEFIVAALARKTGRPVKMLWTREEIFYAHRGRHAMQMHYRTTAKADGTITGVDAKILIDGGSYSSFGLVTTYYSGQLLTGPYDFPNYRFDSTRVFTNKPPCGPKRGHGSVQPRFAFEVQLDEVAAELGIDPIEIRRKNFLGDHTTTVNGQRVTSNGFLMCLDEVERASDWKNRKAMKAAAREAGAASGNDFSAIGALGAVEFGGIRGLGVDGSMYFSGTNYPVYPNKMPQAGVQLKLDRSGLVTIFTGGNDIGQGSNSMVAYCVAEELGIRPEHITVVAADTDLCPVDLGAYSSRVTFMVGNAAIDGARKIRKKITSAVAEHWQVDVKDVRLMDGQVIDLSGEERTMTHVEAFHLTEEKFDTLGETGSYNTPTLGGDYRGGTIGASPAYSFTAHAADVSVDTETGEITVHKVWVAHDCGRALNPTIVRGQMEGSTYMGAGEVVLENHDLNRFGLHAGPSLLDYRIPTTLDTPELEALIVESIDPEGPYGAKEAGEGPLHSTIPAIANAIYDAVGIRLRELPFSPAKVLAALQEKQQPSEMAAAKVEEEA